MLGIHIRAKDKSIIPMTTSTVTNAEKIMLPI
jgi:hypothetical protein